MFSDRQILADFEAEIRSGGRKREKERVLRGCALTRVDGCRVNPREASSQGADDNRLIWKTVRWKLFASRVNESKFPVR